MRYLGGFSEINKVDFEGEAEDTVSAGGDYKL